MVTSHLYIEGGDSKEDQIRCREGFRKLLEKCGFAGRLPRLSACGSRISALDDFTTAHSKCGSDDFIALLVDSEDPFELQESALPALNELEKRSRKEVHDKLVHATRECSNAYKKGKRSFEVVAILNSSALKSLPSFARMIRILNSKL